MKKKLLNSMRMLLVAAGLCVGASAWAYELPSGYEIKDVIIGTDNGDGTVTAETFSSGTFDTSIYGDGTLYHASGYSSKVYLTDFSSSYVAAPAVDASVGETVPTYVGGTTDATKNVMTFHTRGKGTSYGTINFNHKIITRGKLVFSVDLSFGGYNKTNAPQVIFVDKQGNPVLQLGFKCNSGDQEYFQYAVNGGTAYNDGTVSSSKLRDKYTGHSLRDIVIDMETGKVVYTLDCINKDGVRKSMTTTKDISIGTGKNIAGIRISRDNGSTGSQSYYTYLDNIELYTVVPTSAASHTYTINAKAGSTTLKTLATSTCTEYQDYEVYLPKCVLYNSQYYVLSDNNLPASSYNAYYTMGTGDEVKEVSYTLDETIVYYAEAESSSGTNIKYSNGGDGPAVTNGTNYQCRGKDMGNQTAGIYTATVVVTGSTGRALHVRSVPLNYNAGTGNDNSVATDLGGFTQSNGEQTLSFILTEGKKLILNGANSGTKTNQSLDFDYIIVRKNHEITGEIVGAVDNTTNYAAVWNTTLVWINAGETGYYKFINFNNTASANLYENWYLWAANEDSENLVIFGPNHSNTATNGTYTSKPTFTMADLYGATVELFTTLADAGDGTYTLTTTAVTTKADGTTLSPNLVYTQTGINVSMLKLYVSVEKSWLEILEQGTYPTNVSKSITTAGWATYCSPYALDLENATNLTDAYIVTGGAGGVLTKNSVKDGTVPANTGLLLKGTEGSAVEVTIPVIASSSTDVSANKLEGKTAEYALAAEGGYVLMNDATNGLGFYLNTKAFTVGANTAYLPNDFDSTGGEARSFFALFGDDATGIEDAVKSEEIKVKSFFNLNGQRVNQPSKGLYIVNGKKVIIK